MDPTQDAQQNKSWAILAYILFLIPLLGGPKDSKFARYHTNQGLNFLILWIALAIVRGIVYSIYVASVLSSSLSIFALSGAFGGGWIAITLVSWAITIIVILFFVLGVVNAYKGEMKPLPLVGKINILKVDM
jgi:uncharacterized membrane protein